MFPKPVFRFPKNRPASRFFGFGKTDNGHPNLEMVRVSKRCRQRMEEDLKEYETQHLREAAEGRRSITKARRQ